MQLNKEWIWDYDANLKEILLTVGGQACLDRFNAIRVRAEEPELPKVKAPTIKRSAQMAAALEKTEQIRAILYSGVITDSQLEEYATLRCSGISSQEINETMCISHAHTISFITKILKLGKVNTNA